MATDVNVAVDASGLTLLGITLGEDGQIHGTTKQTSRLYRINTDDGTVELIEDSFSPSQPFGLAGTTPVLLGDVNCDDEVNLLDVAPFIAALNDGSFVDKADINSDGSVNLLHVAPFAALLSGN